MSTPLHSLLLISKINKMLKNVHSTYVYPDTWTRMSWLSSLFKISLATHFLIPFFFQTPYLPFLEAFDVARRENKMLHSIVLWGALDDQSCWGSGRTLRDGPLGCSPVQKLLREKFVSTWTFVKDLQVRAGVNGLHIACTRMWSPSCMHRTSSAILQCLKTRRILLSFHWLATSEAQKPILLVCFYLPLSFLLASQSRWWLCGLTAKLLHTRMPTTFCMQERKRGFCHSSEFIFCSSFDVDVFPTNVTLRYNSFVKLKFQLTLFIRLTLTVECNVTLLRVLVRHWTCCSYYGEFYFIGGLWHGMGWF